MYTREITVKNEVGLHARPATYFIQKANEFKSGIWVEKEERRVNAKSLHFYSTCHGTGLTECNEKMVITPTKPTPYGENVGIMLDLGMYGHPNTDICGGCVEDAYIKRGNKAEKFSDMPVDVQDLVGKGL